MTGVQVRDCQGSLNLEMSQQRRRPWEDSQGLDGQKQCQKPPAEEEARRRLPPRAFRGNTALQTLCTLNQRSSSCSSLGILSQSPLQDPTAPAPLLGCGRASFYAVAIESQHSHGEQKPHLWFVFPSPHARAQGEGVHQVPGRTPGIWGDTNYLGGH